MNNEYMVNIRRDTRMMKTFVKFNNRVHHPRVSLHLFIIGVALLGMPIAAGGGKLWGIMICVILGGFLIFMSLFRHNIAVSKMKKSPDVIPDEKLSYVFNEKGVQVIKDEKTSNMGSYKKIYQIWEDEKNYYVGMNEEDLLILPKDNFVKGNMEEFREFILNKSKADYRWQPINIINISKQIINKLKALEAEQRASLNPKKK